MAFTLAHMAAALPFYKRSPWLSFDALLIGTIMPDLPYYVPLLLGGGTQFAIESHQWTGLFSYCIPRGMILFILWVWWLRPALNALVQPWLLISFLLPNHAVTGLTKHQDPNNFDDKSKLRLNPLGLIRFWLVVMVSLLLGAISHLLWDGITHPDGFVASRSSWLQYSMTLPYVGTIVTARILQYVTSIIGLIWLVVFTWQHASRGHNRHTFNHVLQGGSMTKGTVKITETKNIAQGLIFDPMILNKPNSLAITALITFIPILWAFKATISMSDMFFSNNYGFFVMLLLGFFKRLGFCFLLFTAGYHLINIRRYYQFKSAALITSNNNDQ